MADHSKKLAVIILLLVFLLPSVAIWFFSNSLKLASIPLVAAVYALAMGLGKAFEAGGNPALMSNEMKDMYKEDKDKSEL